MFELAAEKGAKLVLGRATSVDTKDGKVTGVRYVNHDDGKESVLPATDVVLAAGAWTPSVVQKIPIGFTRAHSITMQVQDASAISPYVLFTEIKFKNNGKTTEVTPEIYARPQGEVYACGPGDDSALPVDVDNVQCDDVACQSIHDQVTSISNELESAVVTAKQACFLPVVSVGGGPIIGEAKSIAKRLFVATGHTCWGICNAPGTAKAVAELILDGQISCGNLKKLDPSRFIK